MKKFLLSSLFLLFLLSIIIFSCTKKNTPEPAPAIAVTEARTFSGPLDTISSLNDMRTDSAIWKLDGTNILVTHEASTDEEHEQEYNRKENKSSACQDDFAGSARKPAKISFSSAASVCYSDISILRSTLPTDTYMQSIGLNSNSVRVSEEQRNVQITHLYLYAITRESDNDYHMIFGDKQANTSNILNCEVSGLPLANAASYGQISAVRNYIKNFFGTDFCAVLGYTRFSPAIPVRNLKGSLFYDIDHTPGTVGPSGMRPSTSWEMHPISFIAF